MWKQKSQIKHKLSFNIKDTPFAENSRYHLAEQIFEWSEINWQSSCVICKWTHQIFLCTEKTNNQTPKFVHFPFRKNHIVLLHQQLKYDRAPVFILWSHIQIPSVQHLEQICSDYSGWKLLWSFVCCYFIWNKSLMWYLTSEHTDVHVKVRRQQQNFGCSDFQDSQVLTLTGCVSHRLWRNLRDEAVAEVRN